MTAAATAPATASPRAQDRLAALDGLRGLAVLLVLAEHFTHSEWIRNWAPGSIGVRTFFVLSGFLITAVLLELKARHAPAQAARRFFARRLMRLAPPFVIAVALSAMLGLAEMRDHWPWHLAYLSNVHVWALGRWTGAGHFWTLAVEQQFYLLWFPLVMLLSRRALALLSLVLLLAAFLFRSAILFGASPFIDVLLPAQADALAAGTLLCLARLSGREGRVLRGLQDVRCMLGLLGALGLVSALPALGLPRHDLLGWVIMPSLIVATAASVIAWATDGGPVHGLLDAPPLIGIGRISYGLYVYHYFVPQAFAAYLPMLAEADGTTEKLVRLSAWLAVAFALAFASWHLVERPLLERRHRLHLPAR